MIDQQDSRRSSRNVYLNGNDVKFENVKFFEAQASTDGFSYSNSRSDDYRYIYTGTFSRGRYNINLPEYGFGKGGRLTVDESMLDSQTGFLALIHGFDLSTYPAQITPMFENDSTIEVNGGTLNNLYITSCGTGLTQTMVYKKNVNIIANNNSIIKNVSTNRMTNEASLAPIVNGAIQIVLNDGSKIENNTAYAFADSTRTKTAPVYILSSSKDSGGSLDVTDVAGTFKVITQEGYYAVAQSISSGGYYVSEEGLLTVPPGQYTVTYTDTPPEIGLIKIYIDGVLQDGNFATGSTFTLPAALPDKGTFKFAGWTYDGNTYAAGQTITITLSSGEMYFNSKFEPHGDRYYLYVSASGNDNNTGYTSAEALQTISKAEEILSKVPQKDKRVIICGTVSFTAYSHSDMIIIEGDGSGNSHLIFDNSVTHPYGGPQILGPTTFKNINIRHTSTTTNFVTFGNELVIGEGVTNTYNKNTSAYLMQIWAGQRNNYDSSKPGPREKITLNSGCSYSYIGSFYNESGSTIGYTEGADITVNGGWHRIILGGSGYGNNMKYTEFTEVVNIVVNGGTLNEIIYNTAKEAYYPRFRKGVQIVNNGGTINRIELPSNICEDLWYLDCTGGSIEPTTTPGRFIIKDTRIAVATSLNTDAVYVSSDGILTVPAGEYKIIFVDKLFYKNSGVTITVLSDCVLDFETVYHREIENKLFVGWYYSNGTPAVSGTFKAGTVLSARYVDYNPDDFCITGDELSNSNPGLRFTLRRGIGLSKDLGNITDLGTIILPTEILENNEETFEFVFEGKTETAQMKYADLVDGETYLYKGTSYSPLKVSSQNTYKVDAKYNYYTVVMTDLPNYDRWYTVRGYITYTDANAVSHTIYTDYLTANAYKVVRELDSTEYQDNSFYKTVRDSYVAKMESYVNQPKITLYGNSSDKRTWIYTLGNGGTRIREVEISNDTIPGDDPVTIVHMTDFHFNFMNKKDLLSGNPTLLSTWKNRTFNKNGTVTPAIAAKVLEYAAYVGDQIVVTGDSMDTLSFGSASVMQKLIWDKYPGTLVTAGNHEWAQNFEGNYPETLSWEHRANLLENIWAKNHDLYYTSKVIKNKVMVIQMDNGSSKFWPQTVEPFTRDLALAKEKGYTVLIFMHLPLKTENRTDAAAVSLDGTSTQNFATGARYVGGSSSTGATKTIYDLITNNADIIAGIFTGDAHQDFYTEIVAKTSSGVDTVIPQYVLHFSQASSGGTAIKITVR